MYEKIPTQKFNTNSLLSMQTMEKIEIKPVNKKIVIGTVSESVID